MFKLSKADPLEAQIDWTDSNPEFDNNLDKSTDEHLVNIIRERSETL